MKIAFLFSVLLTVAKGRQGFGPGEQDWGYVTVRPQAHMFWWLYETTADVPSKTDRPLIIWLQGGPGASSSGLGNFGELGPLDIDLKPRNYTWIKNRNVLFIDNPVGTGFSYVDRNSAFATTNTQVAHDLITCLNGFYEKHPEFLNVPLYIAAQSYGGKFAVEFALELDKKIKAGNVKSNLEGIALIDCWISPIDSVLTWAPYLYNIGALDRQGYNIVHTSAQRIKSALDDGRFELATKEWKNTQHSVNDVTFDVDWYNILTSEKEKSHNAIEALMNGPVKMALDLNAAWFYQNWDIWEAFAEDFMKSVTDIVEQVLNNTDIKVAVINGQLDLVVDTPGTVKWVDRLRWPKSNAWQQTPRIPLLSNEVLEGYKKILGQFALYWVNRSGHMVPKDNPAAMESILEDLMRTSS